MHERFSDRARHAMALANLEASKLKHTDLKPAHLMLGLIAEGDCVATKALRVLDVDLNKIRAEVSARMEAGNSEESMGRRAHTEELRTVVNMAIQEARKLKNRYIGTEHLILGLLAQADSIPAQVLSDHGLNIQRLREKTMALLDTTDAGIDPSHDLEHSRHGTFEWVHQQELAKAFRSSSFWHTLLLAVDTANRMGAGEIEPPHLLLALLRDPDNGLATLLAEKGVTVEWLRERLAEKTTA